MIHSYLLVLMLACWQIRGIKSYCLKLEELDDLKARCWGKGRQAISNCVICAHLECVYIIRIYTGSLNCKNFTEITLTGVVLEVITVVLVAIPSPAVVCFFLVACVLFSFCFPVVLQSCLAVCQRLEIQISGPLLQSVLLFSFSSIHPYKILHMWSSSYHQPCYLCY